MTETCRGCEYIRLEDWPRDMQAVRCFNRENGERCGRVLDVVRRENPVKDGVVRPKWCRKGKGQ